MSADTNRVSAPSTNPKPLPNTRPAGMRRKKTGSKPVTPLGSRSAVPHAARTPSRATALESIEPSATSVMTMASSSGRRRAKTHGASLLWARFSVPSASMRNGQKKATSPNSDASANARLARRCSR